MMSLFSISCLITFFVSLLFAFFILLNNKKSKLNIFWFLTALSISIWSLGFWGVVSSKDYRIAYFFQYLLDFGGILVPIVFFNFIIELLGLWGKMKRGVIVSWVTGMVLVGLSFTPLFKKGLTSYQSFAHWVDPGPLYALFPITFVFFTIYSLILLITTYKKTDNKILKGQIKFIIFAQIFGFGGGITNFFPQLFKVYPFGNYFVIVYIIFISYAILKHHLFNIKVVATELFTFAIWIVLLTKVFFSTSTQDFIVNLTILFSVVFFGIMMIRAVIEEFKQREEIEKLAADIKKAYEVEKKAREELEKLDAVKNQFLLTIQHHLRTPLTSMMGYTDLLLKGQFGKVPKKIEVVVQKFQSSTNELIKMVNEFLDITQFQLGKRVILLKDGVDAQEIAENIVNSLMLEAQSKKINLNFERIQDDCLIKADPEKLKAAMANIIDNAVKYTNQGGVSVKIRRSGSDILIEVKDTGIGISKVHLQNLFGNIFERGEEAKKTFTTGRGIGLYLAAQIIQAHNGKIWAESEGEGKGATFFIQLPM